MVHADYVKPYVGEQEENINPQPLPDENSTRPVLQTTGHKNDSGIMRSLGYERVERRLNPNKGKENKESLRKTKQSGNLQGLQARKSFQYYENELDESRDEGASQYTSSEDSDEESEHNSLTDSLQEQEYSSRQDINEAEPNEVSSVSRNSGWLASIANRGTTLMKSGLQTVGLYKNSSDSATHIEKESSQKTSGNSSSAGMKPIPETQENSNNSRLQVEYEFQSFEEPEIDNAVPSGVRNINELNNSSTGKKPRKKRQNADAVIAAQVKNFESVPRLRTRKK